MTDDISSFVRRQPAVPNLSRSCESSGAFGGLARALRPSPTLLGVVAVVALWFLRRPYVGVWHDARIYMGKGLADLDPAGVGADLFFKYDAQSSFSVFSRIVDALIPLMGYGRAGLFLTILALALWLAALAGLTLRLASGRLFWAILVAVAAARGSYGAFEILHWAESFPTPRPFAEAAVLAALSALLARAHGRMTLLLLLAAAFHPLMALAGAGTAYVDFCLRDRRWLYLGLAGLVAALVAALAGAPLLTHLVERYDPQWLLMLRLRSSYLFPSMWGEAAYAPILVQTATLGFAAFTSPPRLKRFFLAVLVASLGGLAVSYLFGDLLPLVLVVQAQSWRMLWLLSLFGVVATCFCVPRLWTQGPAGRAALGLFAIAWIGPDGYESAFLCAAAIVLYLSRDAISLRLARLFACAVASVAALYVLGALGVYAFAAYKGWREASPAGLSAAQLFSSSPLAPTAITLLALAWASTEFRLPYRFLGGVAATLALLLCLGWSAQTPLERAFADDRRPRDLEEMLAAHPGEVLWIGENEAPWLLLGRANWTSYLQGGGAVFSRPLAMAFADRMLALRENDWIDRGLFEPAHRKGAVETALPELTREKVQRICARADAPAWILASVNAPGDVAPELSARFWRGPTKYVPHRDANGTRVWDEAKDTAVIDCAAFRS